ncbi:hypothetical protein Y88_0300 [Novosphingobium nitrogenifigens DSM 19370]|uniref:Polymerase nucleotidyl transferase domain-containing protein n=1 Tax=Novosphingobium nitrogenifigens DSM 19370 TaxID=983920 RepID=F1ZAX4_9SPHN|nr:hypothetical protein [Novosphingobium nitrogenifigens]EGD58248.1 hypothetical protein Y88_0300 [Novosphingobium nitrogenifigens DSM 19370]
MNLAEFEGRYGATERRRYLIGLLKNELDHIVAQQWLYSVFVFGSLVNSDKDEPGDIDVLLCISKPFGADPWSKITASDDIHIKSCQLSPNFDPEARALPSLRPCHGVEEMVRLFNESTKNTDENIEISADQCIEVTL